MRRASQQTGGRDAPVGRPDVAMAPFFSFSPAFGPGEFILHVTRPSGAGCHAVQENEHERMLCRARGSHRVAGILWQKTVREPNASAFGLWCCCCLQGGLDVVWCGVVISFGTRQDRASPKGQRVEIGGEPGGRSSPLQLFPNDNSSATQLLYVFFKASVTSSI